MEIPYVDLSIPPSDVQSSLLEAVKGILESGHYILGEEVEKFETAFAALCGTSYAIGVNSGTDALFLTLKALDVGPGDEVITAPNSFLASASTVMLAGARPVFADVGPDYQLDPNCVEDAITPRTRAIVAVHLTGMPADMNALRDICDRHGLALLEDAAQAVCSTTSAGPVGGLGDAGCFSLHPLKNLSAFGDGGIITTNDKDLNDKLRLLRNHGLKGRDEWVTLGFNSRLDAIQAAMLNQRLPLLPHWTEARRQNAQRYTEALSGLVDVPIEPSGRNGVYHTYVIQSDRRDALQTYLAANGIGSAIHYPVPIHLQPAAHGLGYKENDLPIAEAQAKRILSLPVYPGLNADAQSRIIQAVSDFFRT